MATGAPGTNGVWLYGEDDSEATFSALLNKAGTTVNTQLGLDRARLTDLEQAGRVLQTVNATTVTGVSTNSTSWTSTGLTATITPRFANSKIAIVLSSAVSTNSTAAYGLFTVFRGTTAGTNLAAGGSWDSFHMIYPSSGATMIVPCAIVALDSPATTSATTYTFAYRASGSSATLQANANNTRGSITLMEIKG